VRAARRRRPRQDARLAGCSVADLEKLSVKVQYVISAEHKDYLTSAGPARLRSDASACPRGLARDEVEEWLREAIREGWASAHVENDFPRYVWIRKDGRVYEARLSNSGLGQYKGYPILDHEAPRWLP
jgi:hypothetical protein